jgi:hypothetical protein
MSIFSKKIITKIDHHAVLKKAIDEALEAAMKNVPLAAIVLELNSRAAHFSRMQQSQIEARQYNPNPNQSPVEEAQARRAEAQRTAEALRQEQADYAAAVDARGRAEAARR